MATARMMWAVGGMGPGRLRLIRDLDDFDDLQLVGGGLDVELLHGGGDSIDLDGGVVDIDGDVVGGGLERGEVAGLVVGDADHVHPVFGHVDGEVAMGVGGGRTDLLHAGGELQQRDGVARGGFAHRAIGHGARHDSGGVGQEGEGKKEGEKSQRVGDASGSVHETRIRQGTARQPVMWSTELRGVSCGRR
jgi:hypothetical protein